ncbi:MAG: class I SAM-dependent methyltransferase [Bradymonadales bacterium]|nr:MAG: class I SAM-dependent methyltransferase [Bradymonadales bacterium]
MSFHSPTLSPLILSGLRNKKITELVLRTLAEDLATFKTPKANELAQITMEKLMGADENYPIAARSLALEVYPNWEGQDVRHLYHQYNWEVERKGSAATAAAHVTGTSLLDIGGGPGTFSLELLKMRPSLKISVADIHDWRNEDARANPSIGFQQMSIGKAFPIADKSFDTGTLLYVLHHVESDHDEFLKECARCVKQCLILFEDVKVSTTDLGIKSPAFTARPLEADFLRLNLSEQAEFIALVDYICNHIASRELSMPVPGRYYELHELREKLVSLFPTAEVKTFFHGIYDTKCYPNPEAMYVVKFQNGRAA